MPTGVSKVVALALQHAAIARKANSSDLDSMIEALPSTIANSVVYVAQKCAAVSKDLTSGPTQYNDRYLFELCACVIFLLDKWHIDRGLSDYRTKLFYPIVVQRFIYLFQESLDVSGIDLVVNNRLSLYFSLLRQHGSECAEPIATHFVELAKRSLIAGPPEVHDFQNNFPVTIESIDAELQFRINLNTLIVEVLPEIENTFEKTYQFIDVG